MVGMNRLRGSLPRKRQVKEMVAETGGKRNVRNANGPTIACNRRAALGPIHDQRFAVDFPRVFFWPPAGFCSSGFGLGAGLCCPPPFAMLHRPFDEMEGIF